MEEDRKKYGDEYVQKKYVDDFKEAFFGDKEEEEYVVQPKTGKLTLH